MQTTTLVVAALIIAAVSQTAQAQRPEEIDETAASEAAGDPVSSAQVPAGPR